MVAPSRLSRPLLRTVAAPPVTSHPVGQRAISSAEAARVTDVASAVLDLLR
jgi:hypothetical protein